MYKELIIGKLAEVTESKDPSLIGRIGLIVGETKNMITLQEKMGRVIHVPKSVVKMKIGLSNERETQVSIVGSELLATPGERIRG